MNHGLFDFAEGTRILAQQDPVIARLVEKTGPVILHPSAETNFAALVRAITYQQLAGPAARAIFGRLLDALDHDVAPERIAQSTTEQLRAAGLSGAKTASILDLTQKTLDGTVQLNGSALAVLSDDKIISALTAVRGIGNWTAEIFLMIHLARPDVMPAADLGIRKGYALGWAVPLPTATELLAIAEKYRPYRSVFSWYCWRADELNAGAAPSAVTSSVE